MKEHNTYIEKYRQKKKELQLYGHSGGDGNGLLFIPANDGVTLCVIASNGAGWDHVSVTRHDGVTPTWDDMCKIKRLFFTDAETVVQYHPPESEYVNNHAGCLHLWRKQGYDFPLPPSIMLGCEDAGILGGLK